MKKILFIIIFLFALQFLSCKKSLDVKVTSKTKFYRVVQYDNDGNKTYTEVKQITID